MISKLNSFQKSWVWKIIPIAIAIPFVYSSITGGNQQKHDPNYLVSFNDGKGITYQTFQQKYQERYNELLKQLGADEFEKYMTAENEQQLRMLVINSLIDEQVILRYVNDLGVTISVEQTNEEIRKTPIFQDNKGKFSVDRFQRILANNGIQPAYYQQLVKSDLEFRTVEKFLNDSVVVVPREIQISAELALPSAEIQVDAVDVSKFTDEISITEEQIQDYYNKNRSKWTIPASAQISYIIYNPDELVKKNVTRPTEAEVKKYFDENQNLFSTNNYDVSDIVVPDLKTANIVLADLRDGKDFAEVAKEFSTDTLTKDDGGYLGEVTLADLPKQLASILELMQVGSTSNAVEVDGEYHIIKLNKKEFKTTQFDEIQDSLTNKLYKERQKEYQEKFLSTLRDITDAGGNITEFAKSLGLEIKTTDEFTQENVPQPLTPSIAKLAFNNTLEVGKVNNPQALDDKGDAIILQLDKFKDASYKPLSEVRDEVVAAAKLDLSQQSQELRLRGVADTLNSGMHNAEESKEILEKAHITLSQTQVLPFYTPGRDNTAYYKELFTQRFNGNKLDYTIVPDPANHLVYFVALHKFSVDKVPDDILKTFNKSLPEVINRDMQNNILETLRLKYEATINYNMLSNNQQ